MRHFKNWALYFFLPVALIYFASRISRSNSAFVYYHQTPEYDGGDLVAIKKLNELVARNFLNRQYYEAVAYTDTGARYFANYNKKHQAILISGDPMSGWSFFFYATPRQLKMIADHKIPADSLSNFLKPFPSKLLSDCPTRSTSLISIF